jgi:LPS sulfotransferase NodH
MIGRPIIIVSPPRSGSTLLFETLALSPDLWSVGGESHRVIEGVESLHPRTRGWHSNRLGAAAADAATIRIVRRRFRAALRDRDGSRPSPPTQYLRLLEKTPRNALRIPFLRRVFPRATFVYLHREPAETMSSMLDGWRSGRYVSYPRLPGWQGLPWSFLLVPQWRTLLAGDLAATVAHQWAMATSILLDDLSAVPTEQRCVVGYADLVADPCEVIARLCRRLGVRWDTTVADSLPLSSTTLDPPHPDKWRRNEDELAPMLEATATVAARAASVARKPEDRQRRVGNRVSRRPTPARHLI